VKLIGLDSRVERAECLCASATVELAHSGHVGGAHVTKGVSAGEREGEREGGREGERERERGRGIGRERGREGERARKGPTRGHGQFILIISQLWLGWFHVGYSAR
jgi:hypothetical protein